MPSPPDVFCERVSKVYGARAKEASENLGRLNYDRERVRREFGCVLAVADVTLSAQAGKTLCIMGLSGSGKSTLIRMLNGLIQPSVGKVEIKGDDIAKCTDGALRKLRAERIGMVFQSMALWPHLNVLKNVAFPLMLRGIPVAKRNEVAQEKLSLVGLGGWEDKQVHELSGGMQQRVGLARALAADPPILLMDEPFSALDPLIRRQLQNEFMSLSKTLGKTVVFITHDIDEALKIGDEIAIMREGRIIQFDTAAGILSTPADHYVREFTAGASRVAHLRARDVMQNVHSPYPSATYERVETIPEDAILSRVIDAVLGSEVPLIVVDHEGGALGSISREDVLRSIGAG